MKYLKSCALVETSSNKDSTGIKILPYYFATLNFSLTFRIGNSGFGLY